MRELIRFTALAVACRLGPSPVCPGSGQGLFPVGGSSPCSALTALAATAVAATSTALGRGACDAAVAAADEDDELGGAAEVVLEWVPS